MENLTSLILAAAVIILIGIIFYYRKRIRILITKRLHGQYSFRFLNSLPDNILEIKYPPAMKYDPWYVVQGFLNGPETTKYQTSSKIDFKGYEIGKSYPSFYQDNGDPYYMTISENDKDEIKLVVCGFKQQIYNYEAVLLYFFREHTLIAGQYQIRREKQKVAPDDLAAKLATKYSIEEDKIDGSEFKIRDNDGNEVFFQDNGFAIDISIYNPNFITSLQPADAIKPERNKISMDAASVTF